MKKLLVILLFLLPVHDAKSITYNKNHMDNEEILEARKMAEKPNAFNATERFLGTAGKLNYNQKVAMFLTQIYLTKHLTSHF